jgi:hypothetical protein
VTWYRDTLNLNRVDSNFTHLKCELFTQSFQARCNVNRAAIPSRANDIAGQEGSGTFTWVTASSNETPDSHTRILLHRLVLDVLPTAEGLRKTLPKATWAALLNTVRSGWITSINRLPV